MKAIILAAGRGSRMKSFTNTRPKCFAKVKDKRLIDWQLEAIRESEINEIAIVTGYLREQLNILSLVEFYNMTPEQRKEMGQRGQEHVKTNYGFEGFKEQWVSRMLEINEKYGSWENRKNHKSWSYRVFLFSNIFPIASNSFLRSGEYCLTNLYFCSCKKSLSEDTIIIFSGL